MAGIFNAPKLPSATHVIEHGLLVGVVLVLMNAAITLESLEIMTGMIGALAVCVMKGSQTQSKFSSKCTKSTRLTLSGALAKPVAETAPCVHKAEPSAEMKSADKMSSCDPELEHLRACVQAELSTLRAECKLEGLTNKTEQSEAELAQLYDKIAELENDLVQAQSTQMETEETPQSLIDALLMELTEAKLRAEEVEAELVHARSQIAELEAEVHATSIQSWPEEVAQTGIETPSTDLTEYDLSIEDVVDAMWAEDDI